MAAVTAAAGAAHDWEWALETGRYVALGHDFGIRTNDSLLGRHVQGLFAPFRASGEPAGWYSLVDRGPTAPPRYEVFWQGERLSRALHLGRALSTLQWHINQSVIAQTTDHVLVHAAAAESHGVGIAFPAPMESGKTTLVAGLVRAGFRYLTDETVAIDPATLLVKPYAKPLSIDPGSFQVLADLRPVVDARLAGCLEQQWQVPVTGIRSRTLASPVALRLMIAPRYRRGETTRLEPLSRAATLLALAESTFMWHAAPERNMRVLAAVVATCDCYRLVVGDLDDACALLAEVVDELNKAQEETA